MSHTFAIVDIFLDEAYEGYTSTVEQVGYSFGCISGLQDEFGVFPTLWVLMRITASDLSGLSSLAGVSLLPWYTPCTPISSVSTEDVETVLDKAVDLGISIDPLPTFNDYGELLNVFAKYLQPNADAHTLCSSI